MNTPTFEEFLGNKKVYSELKNQYRYLWSRYQDKIKSCFSKKYTTMFESTTETKPSKVGWNNIFICPYTKNKMKLVMPFVGENYFVPIEEDYEQS